MTNIIINSSPSITSKNKLFVETDIDIVLIGCGYAGAMLIRELEKCLEKIPIINSRKINLIVIDRHDILWLKISAIRSSVDPKWVDRTQIPISDIIKHGHFIHRIVKYINKDTQTVLICDLNSKKSSLKDSLKDFGLEIHYDILLCASGAKNGSPADIPERITYSYQIKDYLYDIQQSIFLANEIVIIGGGMTSIEYAGEIRYKYPEKKIKIICAAADFFSSAVAKPTRTFINTVKKRLIANNIDIIFNERVINPSINDFMNNPFLYGHRIIETKNLKIEADLVIWAGSWYLNNQFYPPEWVNQIGELNIRNTFQLENEDNVFAFGDISSLLETKQVITLSTKIPIIIHNIMAVLKCIQTNGEMKSLKLKKYKLTDRALIYLPIGPYDGVSLSKFGFTYGPKKTSKWKGKDLFVEKFWNEIAEKKAPLLNDV